MGFKHVYLEMYVCFSVAKGRSYRASPDQDHPRVPYYGNKLLYLPYMR